MREPVKPNDSVIDLRGFYGIKSIVDAENKVFLLINCDFFQPMFEDCIADNINIRLSKKRRRALLKDLMDCLRGEEKELEFTHTLE